MLLDDQVPVGHDRDGHSISRQGLAVDVDQYLARPFDPQEAEVYDRENWGVTQREVAQTEALLGSLPSGATYGEPDGEG